MFLNVLALFAAVSSGFIVAEEKKSFQKNVMSGNRVPSDTPTGQKTNVNPNTVKQNG